MAEAERGSPAWLLLGLLRKMRVPGGESGRYLGRAVAVDYHGERIIGHVADAHTVPVELQHHFICTGRGKARL